MTPWGGWREWKGSASCASPWPTWSATRSSGASSRLTRAMPDIPATPPTPETPAMAALPAPTVLILAGQRLGKVDPLAEAHGAQHKCLVPLLGRPLIGYVLDAVDAAFPDAQIVVSINDPRALDAQPEARRFFDAGRIRTVVSE